MAGRLTMGDWGMQKLPSVTATLVALCLGGCVTDGGPNVAATELSAEKRTDYKRPSDAEAMEKARKAVRDKLKDPDSARFTNLIRLTNEKSDAVCGLVNSKNSFGGYAGNEWFGSIHSCKPRNWRESSFPNLRQISVSASLDLKDNRSPLL